MKTSFCSIAEPVIGFIFSNFSGLATLVAAFIAARIARKFQQANLDLSHERMEKDLFKEFNERYDKLNDHLSQLSSDLDVGALKEEYHHVLKSSLIDYFNLCAEQYYWYSKGRISEAIWTSWHAGMMTYYNTYPVVRELWKLETDGGKYKSYYLTKDCGFFEGKPCNVQYVKKKTM